MINEKFLDAVADMFKFMEKQVQYYVDFSEDQRKKVVTLIDTNNRITSAFQKSQIDCQTYRNANDDHRQALESAEQIIEQLKKKIKRLEAKKNV